MPGFPGLTLLRTGNPGARLGNSSRARNPPHLDRLLPLPRPRNLMRRLHPHQRIHLHAKSNKPVLANSERPPHRRWLHAKRLLNPQRHLSRREGTIIAPDEIRATWHQKTLPPRKAGAKDSPTRLGLLRHRPWPILNLHGLFKDHYD
jgi:hypothetical protein